MSFSKPAPRTILPAALVALAVLVACGGRPSDEAAPERYRVRGVVRQLPPADRPGGEIHVRHEAIPEFKDADGEVVGMEPMTMPFPLADPELLAGLEVGDKIEMEFEVRWHGDYPLRVTAIAELPPETPLEL